jgi:transposase-like protein
MHKVPPSEKLRKEIDAVLSGEVLEGEKEELLGSILEKSVQLIVQKVVEQEVDDYLGRGYYQRDAASRPGHRNGYESKRLKTAEGAIRIEAPQLRGTEQTYRSEFMKRVERLSPQLRRMAVEMYVRGLSTRDIEEVLRDPETGSSLLSKDGVSELTEELWEEYEGFCERDLSGYDVLYLFVDGVFESLRQRAGMKEAILCCWGITSSRDKVLLHLGLGNKESYESWRDFIRHMQGRGLRVPLLVVGDGAPGQKKAISECFSESRRQRCLFHKMGNIRNKLPQEGIDEVMPQIKSAYYQTDAEIARLCASKILEAYSGVYPSAMKCFQEDFDACIQHMEFPAGHQRHITTTNLLERVFEEQKRRTKVIPRFFDEKSCLKLVYATLIRVSQKWRRVKMSEYDLTLLRNLRKLYGWTEDEGGYISKHTAA